MRRLAVLLVALLQCLAPNASAAAQALSLLDARAEARSHAPEVAELEARLRGADAVLGDAARVFRRDPWIEGSYSTGALTGSPDEHAVTVGVRMPVDISGSWTPRGASARADRNRAGYERDDGLRALDEAVAIALADVALAQRLARRAERVVSLWVLALTAERERLLRAILKTRDADGTWNDRVFDRSRAYGTAMVVLALLGDASPLPPPAR